MALTLKTWDAATLTEVRPGDTIRSVASGRSYTLHGPVRVTEDNRDGRIQVRRADGTGGREYHAGLFGLHVTLTDTLQWHDAGTDEPRDIMRDLDVPGGYLAMVMPDGLGRFCWRITNGTMAFAARGDAADEASAKAAVDTWEDMHRAAPEPGLRVFREDGTEVLPGDQIIMAGIGEPFTFVQAVLASNDSGTDGMITAEKAGRNYPDLYSAPFGLVVREVTSDQSEPAWESAMTGEPGDIQRDIRGPGGFWALVGPDSAGRWDWSVIDYSDGGTVVSGNVASQEAARQAVTDWERENGLIPEPETSGQPELTGRLAAAVARLDGDYEPEPPATAALSAISNALQDACAAPEDTLARIEKILAGLSSTDELAAEADQIARTTAPPVPGVTRNGAYTVYAVLGRRTAITGSLMPGSWYVAAVNDRGEHVTWNAFASNDGSGRLHYDGGHYHTPGEGADAEALVDLAKRAGVFRHLDNLSSGPVTRTAFQDSHEKVMDELSGIHDVGRARIRAGLLEAAALGYARISWTSNGRRRDYGIRYDRVQCTFTWAPEN